MNWYRSLERIAARLRGLGDERRDDRGQGSSSDRQNNRR